MNRKIIFEFISIFVAIFILIFLVSNFSTVYSLVYYQFTKNVPRNKGTFFDSKKQYENQIIIPKIEVSAPVIFSENRGKILDDLKRGVVYLPQENAKKAESGILLGHSSRLLLDPGKYDIVFIFLSKLEKDDKIFVYFGEKKFKYKIVDKKIISSDTLSRLDFKNKKPTLYLVTCWPPGTNLKRLVVEARKL